MPLAALSGERTRPRVSWPAPSPGSGASAAGAPRLVSRAPAEVSGEGAENHTRGRVRSPIQLPRSGSEDVPKITPRPRGKRHPSKGVILRNEEPLINEGGGGAEPCANRSAAPPPTEDSSPTDLPPLVPSAANRIRSTMRAECARSATGKIRACSCSFPICGVEKNCGAQPTVHRCKCRGAANGLTLPRGVA